MNSVSTVAPTIDERNIINDCFGSLGGDGYREDNLVHVFTYAQGRAIVNAQRDGVSVDQVHFGLIANDNANGIAMQHPKHHHVVGLFVGLVNELFHASSRLHPSEEGEHPIGTLWFALAQLAVSFIIEHEYAHISNGHLLLVQAKSAAASEMRVNHDDEGSLSLTKFDVQTLEMDADACAITRTALWAAEMWQQVQNGGTVPAPLKPLFDELSEAEVLINVLRAVTIATASLPGKDPYPEHCFEQTHLPRSARVYHAAGLLEDISKKYFDYSLVAQVGRSRLAETVDEVFSTLRPDQPINKEIVRLYLAEQGHIHQLTDNWRQKIAPGLRDRADAPGLRK